jgi:hypothetical protein
MIENYHFQDMRINEKGTFADKLLAVTNGYGEKDAELKPLLQNVTTTNTAFSKALEKLSLVELTALMDADDDQRDSGIGNLESYALSCANRKNPIWAHAGQVVVDALKAVGWDMNYRANSAETKLVDTFLAQIESQPALKQALTTINAQEWIDEIREGQTSYKQHDQQRLTAKNSEGKVSSKLAARQLGEAIDKMVRYINFQIEYKNREDYRALSFLINTIIAEFATALKQRATRAQNAKDGKLGEK